MGPAAGAEDPSFEDRSTLLSGDVALLVFEVAPSWRRRCDSPRESAWYDVASVTFGRSPTTYIGRRRGDPVALDCPTELKFRPEHVTAYRRRVETR